MLFPCNECAKAIIQTGIKEVIYLSDKYAKSPNMQASRRMLESASVKMRQLKVKHKSLTVNLDAEACE